MGIQRKLRSTLQELLKSQLGGKASEKAAQTRPPIPQNQTRLPTPPPTQHTRADPIDHKRKREDKGKEAMEPGKTHSSQ